MPDAGFKLAFGVMDYTDRTKRYDPTQIRWRVTLDTYKDLQIIETKYLDVELCTEQDFTEFYPVVSQSANFLKEIRAKDVLYCI